MDMLATLTIYGIFGARFRALFLKPRTAQPKHWSATLLMCLERNTFEMVEFLIHL